VTDSTRIRVAAEHPYDVVVGHHLLGELPALLGAAVQRVAVIHPGALRDTGEAVRADLTGSGLAAVTIETPDGEQAKTAEVASYCWSVLGQSGFTRSDAVVGVGGGATTDLAGFVAATWLRGVRVVHLPTTLLGMVDAAIGGKTAINTAEGKNLVGAFHEPAGVLCDLSALETLPRNDFVSGLAEVLKVGFTSDQAILDLVAADPAGAAVANGPHARELIERAIAVKAAVVSGDLREAGGGLGRGPGGLGREVLNYGHTFGHAVERVERYQWRHGAAVSVGMMYVAHLAALAGRLSHADVTRHRELLAAVGLPTTYPPGRWAALHDAMRLDKKARGDRLRFVVLDRIGAPALLEGPDPALLVAAYEEVCGP